MRHALLLLSMFAAPVFAQTPSCQTPALPQASAAGVAPLATELSFASRPLGVPTGVLSQAYDEALSVDNVLLRRQLDACYAVATAAPAPGVVGPGNPAAYKPKTQYDNTPWRFNMSQNGKKMTADEFAAWMEARGVHVARGAASAAPASVAPLPPPPPASQRKP